MMTDMRTLPSGLAGGGLGHGGSLPPPAVGTPPVAEAGNMVEEPTLGEL